MTSPHASLMTPGIAVGLGSRRTTDSANDDRRNARFVTQSHALGAPIASPRALIIAAAVIVAVLLIGFRLSSD
jgi:hypothetical protein